MPVFLSDEELDRFRSDGVAVAEKADVFIRELYSQLETAKAQADAASITADQRCSLLEQQYISLSSEFSNLESQNSQLESTLQQRISELAELQSEKHQLHIKIIEKDGETERLSAEVSELQKSKRQLMAMLEQKDSEIGEKNFNIQSYLDKIEKLAESAAEKEARCNEAEAEATRSKAISARILQEKELVERHNSWLNDELTAKTDSLVDFRRRYADFETEMSAKLADAEKHLKESSSSVKWHKERVSELEMKLASLHEDLCSAKDAAAAMEERYTVEISTASKLVELYKESSQEWSKKAGELEGVIKALETHLVQVEKEHKERFEKEVSLRREIETEVVQLKEKLAKCEAEVEAGKKDNELSILSVSTFNREGWIGSFNSSNVSDLPLVPSIPPGVSGTALAASLLRDGWSLAKMYAKYQEAVDALQHEQQGRKQSQAILERVLLEIEEKASLIMDERAEHEKMAEAYDLMNQNLHHCLSARENLEKVNLELKAELRRQERDCNLIQKEVADLQKQVTILLKECRDVQIRCGTGGHDYVKGDIYNHLEDLNAESDTENLISEHLLTFKDIHGLVEQNAKLRSLVRSLSDQLENHEMELRDQFESQMRKNDEESASKVRAVVERAEEQGRMIESLHSSVAMYKRLYEEEHKLRSSDVQNSLPVSGNGRNKPILLLEGSEDPAKNVQDQMAERVKTLELELSTCRCEVIAVRSERDKAGLEANFCREKLDRFLKEHDQQREEMNGVLSRNIELSQLIVDYQKRVRESSESLHAAEEASRKLNMEVSILRREKELLQNSEKRAFDEVRDLSERVHRLQASLDVIQNADQVREEARAAEKKRLEEYAKHFEKEWAEAKKELQAERDTARNLSLDRDGTIKDAMRQVEQIGKELTSALEAASAAEARAAVAEARNSDLERKFMSSGVKAGEQVGALENHPSSATEIARDLFMAKEEIERLKQEVQANKDHAAQYKSIADVSETALKQMESAHENFKIEADKSRSSLVEELSTLKERIFELEKESSSRSEEAVLATTEKEAALASSQAEVANLREQISVKEAQIGEMRVAMDNLREKLEMEQQRCHATKENYERQVVLQSETIHELKRTSEELGLREAELSEVRKVADAFKSENEDLKARREIEKSELEKRKDEMEKKYKELNEQNKILHDRLEALHMKSAEKDRQASGIKTSSAGGDDGSDPELQSVISYLRRSKEIAETEISLLRQEKLRLQFQFDKASKEIEAAQAQLRAERANKRASMFTEDDFKSLQLQVSEINLLRESNNQLREENKRNFEECQHLREAAHKEKSEYENLRRRLREVELQAEDLQKGIELEKIEKENSQKSVAELLEKCKNVDVEDYNRMKKDYQQMQVDLKEKDMEIDELKSTLAAKQEIVHKLEHELAGAKSELIEKEKQIKQLEELRLDSEKQRKMAGVLQRRLNMVSKEKDSVLKEKDSLLQEKEQLSKEKEELNSEIQNLSKQMVDLRQEKKVTRDAPGDQTSREKEKDTRIQMLEKTVKGLRDENKKEKEKRQNIEKAITTKVTNVDQERKKIEDEQERHKEAVRRISEELMKLKHAKDSLPEGTSAVQLLSGNMLNDLASAYAVAVERFERVAHSVLVELGAQTTSGSSHADTSETGQSLSGQMLALSTKASPPRPPSKPVVDKEKKTLSKPAVEPRRPLRRLVRPRLVRTEGPQVDTEILESEGPSNTAKHTGAPEVDTQAAQSLIPDSNVARKRLASSSTTDLVEDPLSQGEVGTGVVAPALKKPKSSEEPTQEHADAPSASVVNADAPSASVANADAPSMDSEHMLDASVEDQPQGSTEETDIAGNNETETLQGQDQEPKEPSETKPQDDSSTMKEENVDKIVEESSAMEDEDLGTEAEQEALHPATDADETEEGELGAETGDGGDDGDDVEMDSTTYNETAEAQPEISSEMVSPVRDILEQPVASPIEDIDDSTLEEDSNAEEGELIDDNPTDKPQDGNDDDQVGGNGEAEQSVEAAGDAAASVPPQSTSAATSSVVTKESSTSPAATEGSEETKHTPASSPLPGSSTTINLSERARLRAMERMRETSTSATVNRGRGRPPTRSGRVLRARGRRGTSDRK